MLLDAFEEFEVFSNSRKKAHNAGAKWLLKSLLKVLITSCIINEIKSYVNGLFQLPEPGKAGKYGALWEAGPDGGGIELKARWVAGPEKGENCK